MSALYFPPRMHRLDWLSGIMWDGLTRLQVGLWCIPSSTKSLPKAASVKVNEVPHVALHT